MVPRATGRRRRFSGKKPHGQAKSACCRRRSALRPADRSDFHASAASALARPGRSHEPVRLWCVKPAGQNPGQAAGVEASASTASLFAGQDARRPPCPLRVVRDKPSAARASHPARFEGELSLSGGTATGPPTFAARLKERHGSSANTPGHHLTSRKKLRTSSTKSSGCSNAAKCPPRAGSFQ
jgi:hypothetical protein